MPAGTKWINYTTLELNGDLSMILCKTEHFYYLTYMFSGFRRDSFADVSLCDRPSIALDGVYFPMHIPISKTN